MICLTTQELSLATGAEVLVPAAFAIEGEVVIDSRLVETGSVFVAFRGERLDGNAYLTRAIGAGAGAVVASADVPTDVLVAAQASGCAVLRAQDDDCEEFLLRLAGEWRVRHPAWTVVGVTGSVGKTTTKDMRAQTVGNIGTIVTGELASREEGSWFVAELSSFQLATAVRLHPRVACLLNITPDHLEWHRSLEAYAAAKERIFANLDAGDLAVVSVDDARVRLVAERLEARGLRVCRLSVHEEPDTPCAAFLRDGMTRALEVAIAAGGTAGHINPALALAEELRSRGHHVTFFGQTTRLEGTLVPQEGFDFFPIVVTGFDRSRPWTLVSALVRERSAASAILAHFGESGRPDVAVGFGAYVELPLVSACHEPFRGH